MEIIEVLGDDDRLLAAWHATYHSSQVHGRPFACPWQLEEVRVDLQSPSRRRRYRAFAGLVDGAVACAGQIGMPLLDNTTTATVDVGTAVPMRRRGYGAIMLAHLIELARAQGRNTLFVEAYYPYDAPADGRGEPGPRFLASHGFKFALGDVHRVLDLPVTRGPLDRLAEEAAAAHSSYRLESFVGPVPEAWLASYVALDAKVSTDAPTGDLDIEPDAVDLPAFRELERTIAAQGRITHAAVALDETGPVVAYSSAATTRQEPGRCYQWGTLVERVHRGHRLGLAVKVANLRLLQREQPELRSMTTFNAEANTHMVGINERLGFRPVERLGEFQLRL